MIKNDILSPLFKIVRVGDAILWIGAGLSYSSGYPSGKKLAEIIFNDLNTQQKKLVDKKLPLPFLAEEYVRITKNREKLISLLHKQFGSKSKVIPKHYIQLGSIFHFDSIITTNYDTLIEEAYGYKCQVIRPKDPVSILNPKKVQVLKVHGDLEDKKNILITSSDYNRFFQKRKEEEGLWTFVKSKLYTKSVIFIGYNLEDPNTSVMFDRIINELNIDARESFLIAPNLPEHQIQNLKDRRVTYLNLYGEEFIDLLVKNIDQHLISDVESGRCDLDTFFKTTQAKDITFNLEPLKNKTKVKSLSGLKEHINTNLNLIFPQKSIVAEKINNIVSGKNFDPVELDAQLFNKIELKVGDLTWGNRENFKTLIIKRLPNHETHADFIFEDEREFNHIPLIIFKGSEFAKFKFQFPSATFTIEFHLEPEKGPYDKFHYSHKVICDRTTVEIHMLELLLKLSRGEKFSILFDNKKLTDLSLGKIDELNIEELLTHFRDLRKIEKFYGKNFVNIPIDSIGYDGQKKVERILSYINKETKTLKEWEGSYSAKINNPKETKEELKSKIESGGEMLIKENVRTEIELYNQEFDIGYNCSIIQRPKVFISKEQKNTWDLKITSANNTLITSFSNDKEFENSEI